MHNHSIEMHRDSESTFGFNRVVLGIGSVAFSPRHPDRLQERDSNRIPIMIVLKSLSHRRLYEAGILYQTSIGRSSSLKRSICIAYVYTYLSLHIYIRYLKKTRQKLVQFIQNT